MNGASITSAIADEVVRQLTGAVGELSEEYRRHAVELTEGALRLATARAVGSISDTDFDDGVKALKLAARSWAAAAQLDLLEQRRKMADSLVSVLMRAALSLA